MKLKTFLSTLNPNKTVAIGLKDGSGYFYFGPAKNVDQISKIFDHDYYMNETQRDLLEKTICAALLGRPDTNDRAVLLECAQKISSLYLDLSRCPKQDTDYIPVMNRDVVQVYKKEFDADSAVIIEGDDRVKSFTSEDAYKTYHKRHKE